MKSITDISEEYEIHRPAVVAILDQYDVPVERIGLAKIVRDEDLEAVRPIFEKLRNKARSRRGQPALI